MVVAPTPKSSIICGRATFIKVWFKIDTNAPIKSAMTIGHLLKFAAGTVVSWLIGFFSHFL
ncbi:hypothetical protein D3C73_1590440 [compost metagenome]